MGYFDYNSNYEFWTPRKQNIILYNKYRLQLQTTLQNFPSSFCKV
jgi:hypothetical protein